MGAVGIVKGTYKVSEKNILHFYLKRVKYSKFKRAP